MEGEEYTKLATQAERLHKSAQMQIDQMKTQIAQLKIDIDRERSINKSQAHVLAVGQRWLIRLLLWSSLLSAAVYVDTNTIDTSLQKLESIIQVLTAGGALTSFGGLSFNVLKAQKQEDVEAP